jgi:hypothetical protein
MMKLINTWNEKCWATVGKLTYYEFMRGEIIQCNERNAVKPAMFLSSFSTELPLFPNLTMSDVQREDFSLCSLQICHERLRACNMAAPPLNLLREIVLLSSLNLDFKTDLLYTSPLHNRLCIHPPLPATPLPIGSATALRQLPPNTYIHHTHQTQPFFIHLPMKMEPTESSETSANNTDAGDLPNRK